MAFPAGTAAANTDDPDSQVAWPGRGDQASPTSPTSPIRFQEPLPSFRGSRADGSVEEDVPLNAAEPSRPRRRPSDSTPKSKLVKRMTLKDFVFISISMLGAQITWTVELGYGTPFLLSLGLSEQVTSLVWLAGPVSGLVAQPLIGAISDSSNSKYRRRYWVVLATVVLIISTLGLAYAKPIAVLFVEIFAGGQGDWDPKREAQVAATAIWFAVFCFYLLDFALNALQASLRNLLLDITPGDQLATGNAWHGRMIHAGNIVGFTFGFLDLAHWPILRELGGDQFRKVCIVSMIILVITVWITCATQHEEAREEDLRSRGTGSRTRDVMGNIIKSISELPKPVRRVCYVQLFAFMGWFPFLFYSTTWVGEVLAYEIDEEPSTDRATRAGEFAMLIYSLVSVSAGTLLPYLAARDRRLLAEKEDEGVDAEISRIRLMVQSWKREAARMGRPLHLPTMPFMLRNIWTSALLLFGIIMMSTFFITKVWQATVAISILGICWAVACWVPFAIIMEFLKELDQAAKANKNRASRVAPSLGRAGHSRVASTPAIWRSITEADERTSLIRRSSLGYDYEAANEMNENKQPVAGGTILGIHNLAIVIPQFIIALVASAIFRIVDTQQEGNDNVYYGKNGVAWVLRFGGLCAFIGAFVSRGVPPTKTEREMRRRLAEMEADHADAH